MSFPQPRNASMNPRALGMAGLVLAASQLALATGCRREASTPPPPQPSYPVAPASTQGTATPGSARLPVLRVPMNLLPHRAALQGRAEGTPEPSGAPTPQPAAAATNGTAPAPSTPTTAPTAAPQAAPQAAPH